MTEWKPKIPDANKSPFELNTGNSKKPTTQTATETIMKVEASKKYQDDLYSYMAEYLSTKSRSSRGSDWLWSSFDYAEPRKREPDDDYAYREARQSVEKFLHKASAHSTGWDDVVGNEAARTALLEAIEHPVKHKDLFAHYGMKASRGVLLWGPPGCGKTMFAKAAASALSRLHGRDCELLIVNGSELQSKWVGETEQTIRQIFAFARAYRKKNGHSLVVFIDEADAMLPPRDRAYRFEASNVATFLTEMDGMEDSGAFVMLATNRPEAIDEAVLRDGRVDRRIKVERPDYDAAMQIAGKHLVGSWCSATPAELCDYLFDPMMLVRNLHNPDTGSNHHFTLAHLVSGAMIVGLVERAKGIAMRRDMADETRLGVTVADLRVAVDQVFTESKGLNHDYALREFVENVAIPAEHVKALRGLN